jgi:hypothetical protein
MKFAIAAVAFLVTTTAPSAGEKQLCNLKPLSAEGWHYRTKINGRPQRCWYVGDRMKPRSELYWAEAPKIPPPMSQTGEFELRWKGGR